MPEPKRILHVLGTLDAGGAETRVMEIYRHIDKAKYPFDFAIHTSKHCFYTDEVLKLGGHIYSLPRFNGINYFKYKKAWEKLLSENPLDVIHGHQTTTAFIYLKVAKKLGIKKRIAHARNANKDSLIKKYLAKLARFYATDLLAVSKLAAISEFGKKNTRTKVKIIPNSFNYKRYEFNEAKRLEVRQNLNISEDTKVYLNVGRFHPQKNHMFLIRLFHQIILEQPHSRLILIGSGPLESKIVKKIDNLGLSEKVHLMKPQSNIEDYYSASDCLLFPSKYEGLPGVVIEAQINGLPCLISNEISKELIISDRVTFLPLKPKKKYWFDFALRQERSKVNKLKLSSKFSHVVNVKIYLQKVY